ncbi:MAG: helix-turn-helix domain-containing protein [Limnobacter sp.]|nr:helix-turn-helix domain-containing protein [Limnobacter sp.]MCZ8014183.1 helix-turn-helix domain-containing protein [Limnobacter sp.]
MFDVQVHRGQNTSAPARPVQQKANGLDQTFNKFREGRFDSWQSPAKTVGRDDFGSTTAQPPHRFKEDGFDARPYDARSQGYLGSRQAARTPVENPINLDDLESKAIQEALENCRGNVSAAARMLGISRNTIYRRLNSK